MELYIVAGAYLAIINLVTFFTYGIDKHRARKNRRRISERTLLTLAAIGGAAGAILAMNFFRHKTLHRRFTIGVPLILLLHIALFCAYRYLT